MKYKLLPQILLCSTLVVLGACKSSEDEPVFPVGGASPSGGSSAGVGGVSGSEGGETFVSVPDYTVYAPFLEGGEDLSRALSQLSYKDRVCIGKKLLGEENLHSLDLASNEQLDLQQMSDIAFMSYAAFVKQKNSEDLSVYRYSPTPLMLAARECESFEGVSLFWEMFEEDHLRLVSPDWWNYQVVELQVNGPHIVAEPQGNREGPQSYFSEMRYESSLKWVTHFLDMVTQSSLVEQLLVNPGDSLSGFEGLGVDYFFVQRMYGIFDEVVDEVVEVAPATEESKKFLQSFLKFDKKVWNLSEQKDEVSYIASTKMLLSVFRGNLELLQIYLQLESVDIDAKLEDPSFFYQLSQEERVSLEELKGMTALMIAAVSEHENRDEMIKILLDAGADPNLEVTLNGQAQTYQSLLGSGAARGQSGANSGASSGGRSGRSSSGGSQSGGGSSSTGATSRRYDFADSGDVMLWYESKIQNLSPRLRNIVTVNNCKSCTALMLAIYYNRIEAARTLIEGGVDVNLENSRGLSPLRYLSDRHMDAADRLSFISLLVSSGAHLDVSLAVKLFLFGYDERIGNFILENASVAELKKLGLRLSFKLENNKGSRFHDERPARPALYSIFFSEVAKRHPAVFEELEFQGTKSLENLLMLMAKHGLADILDAVLSKANVDINVRNDKWETALYFAKDEATAKVLKKHGAVSHFWGRLFH